MTYRYAVYWVSDQTSHCFIGELSVPSRTSLKRVTLKVGQLCAHRAFKRGLAWDPFNLSIAIQPITPTKETTKCTP